MKAFVTPCCHVHCAAMVQQQNM